MSDLHVVAVIKAKQGSESVVQAALEALVVPSNAEEGCLSYELFSSQADPSAFVTVELWRSQADLDAHMASPHLQAALQAAGESLDGAPAIHPLTPVA